MPSDVDNQRRFARESFVTGCALIFLLLQNFRGFLLCLCTHGILNWKRDIHFYLSIRQTSLRHKATLAREPCVVLELCLLGATKLRATPIKRYLGIPRGSFNFYDSTPSSLCGNLPREVLHKARKSWSRCNLVPRAFPSLRMETPWERGYRDGDFSRCWESVKREENSQHWVILSANKKNGSRNRFIIFTVLFILNYCYRRGLKELSHGFSQLKKKA